MAAPYIVAKRCLNAAVTLSSGPWKRALATIPTGDGGATKEDNPTTTTAVKGQFFPRRAVMYVPASDERKTRKVASLGVDSIVFDIEDGVAMNQKVLI